MITEAVYVDIFEEWKRRYDADPEGFMDCEAFKADHPLSYGEGAGRYFLMLFNERWEYDLELDVMVRR